MGLLAVLQYFVEDQAARTAYKSADQRTILVPRHAADGDADTRAGAHGDCRAFQRCCGKPSGPAV